MTYSSERHARKNEVRLAAKIENLLVRIRDLGLVFPVPGREVVVLPPRPVIVVVVVVAAAVAVLPLAVRVLLGGREVVLGRCVAVSRGRGGAVVTFVVGRVSSNGLRRRAGRRWWRRSVQVVATPAGVRLLLLLLLLLKCGLRDLFRVGLEGIEIPRSPLAFGSVDGRG